MLTLDKITEQINKSKNNVEKQSQKVKEIYADQMRTQKEIDKFVLILNSTRIASNPKFYYGNDLEKCFEDKYENEQSNTEKEHNEMSIDDLISVAQGRVDEINSKAKEFDNTQEFDK